MQPTEIEMHAIPVVYKGWTLVPLAAGASRSFASMVVITSPQGERRALGSLGDFPSIEDACTFALECGKAFADGRDFRHVCLERIVAKQISPSRSRRRKKEHPPERPS